MVHLSSKKKLLRSNDHRKAMVNNLLKSLIVHEHLDTTLTKAKVLKSIADKAITATRAKDEKLARRLLENKLSDERIVNKLFLISKRLQNRNSGFTSHVILKNRPGDNSIIARVAWVDKMELKDKKVTKKESKSSEKKEKEVKKEDKKK